MICANNHAGALSIILILFEKSFTILILNISLHINLHWQWLFGDQTLWNSMGLHPASLGVCTATLDDLCQNSSLLEYWLLGSHLDTYYLDKRKTNKRVSTNLITRIQVPSFFTITTPPTPMITIRAALIVDSFHHAMQQQPEPNSPSLHYKTSTCFHPYIPGDLDLFLFLSINNYCIIQVLLSSQSHLHLLLPYKLRTFFTSCQVSSIGKALVYGARGCGFDS